MQYWVALPQASLVPILLLYFAAFCTLLGPDRGQKIARILSGGSVLFLFLLLSEVVSYYSGDLLSVYYGLILLGLFLSARLIVMHLGLLQIIRCYTYSAIFCVLTILITGRKELSGYGAGETRFTGGSGIHPNLIGFTLASYFPLFVGLALDLPRGKKRLFVFGLILLTPVLLFTTGSRGSLGAILIALVVTALRFTVFNRIIGRLRLSALQIMMGLLGLAVIIYIVLHGSDVARASKFVVTALQLDSKQRGIHSGFSGRTTIWMIAISHLSGLQWLFGRGYRQGYVIDSGYVTILYDNGLIGGSVILGSMLRVFFWLWGATKTMESPGWWRYRVVLWSLMMIYFINNVTTRYLFSFGNQFSLLIIFFIVCRKDELLGTSLNSLARARGTVRRAAIFSVGKPRPLPPLPTAEIYPTR
jgi:exopolysaccharide production protein ExoQ